jgi:hypothetical protein
MAPDAMGFRGSPDPPGARLGFAAKLAQPGLVAQLAAQGCHERRRRWIRRWLRDGHGNRELVLPMDWPSRPWLHKFSLFAADALLGDAAQGNVVSLIDRVGRYLAVFTGRTTGDQPCRPQAKCACSC